MNHFQLLNIEQKYRIDQKQLAQNYYALQRKHHPDNAKTTEEKQKCFKLSADINNAYNILNDDLARAEYLLTLNNASATPIINIEQLNAIWEEQEELENINKPDELALFFDVKSLKRKLLMERLEKAFENNKLQDALDVLITLKYLTRLVKNCETKIKQQCK
jgi:molecular chaperone HscB